MKIIFFSSNTATWPFAFAEAAMASALQKKGNDIVFITPGNLFKGISNIKQERILREEFDLRGYEIKSILANEDLKEIDLIIKKINRKNFDKLVIDNIQIGKIAMYEFLLHHKKMNVRFSNKEWEERLPEIKNTLISFYACRKVLKKEKPDRVLMYSALYSVNHVWEKYSKNKGIPVYFLQDGANLSDIGNTLIIAKNNSFCYMNSLKKDWARVKNIPVSKKELSYVTDNFMELLKAKHFLVYSAPKSRKRVNIRKIFNIKESQKILTATMSSYDEVFAADYVGAWNIPKKLIFKSQVEWIKALVEYIKNKPDLFLVIRVHPREFPNKRESLKSEHAKMLEKIFKKLPENVRVNWPTDNLSIYDLAQETDIFLNAWSSVGVEMGLLGIPVVLYSKDLVLYPHDINYVGKDKKDYFDKIELALKKGWSYEMIKKTYRWSVLYFCHTIMRLRDKNTESNQTIVNKLFFPIGAYLYSLLSPGVRGFLVKIYYAIPGLGVEKGQINDCRRQLIEHMDISGVEKMLRNSEDTLVNIKNILTQRVGARDEDVYIRHEIDKIYKAMYNNVLGEDDIKQGNLRYNLKNAIS